MTPISVPLGHIIADDQLQPRVEGLDIEHVHDLLAVVEHWPPLKVARNDERYLLIDGFHRFAAARDLGLASVTVEVVEVSPDDDLHALAFAFNAKHGRPLTLSDRRAFAQRELTNHPDWSDREIARRAGLAQATVAKIRQELEQQTAIPVANTRLGRDGRTYATPKRAEPFNPAVKATLGDIIGDLLSPAERRQQRQLVRYLQQLADFLEHQDGVPSFETFEQASEACRAVLGKDEAEELGRRLGWSAGNILEVARTLGYREERAS